MRVLVTGGAGFIGSHLVDSLIADKHHVTVVDDLSAGRRSNVEKHLGGPGFEFLEADFADESVLSKAVPSSEIVVHLAAMVGVAMSVKEPDLVHATNVNKTLRLLGACAKSGVGRFVLASSASVYGDAPPPVSESTPTSPMSPYAASKVACEAYCRAYQSVYGLSTVVFRFMNVYGPRMGGSYGAVMTEFARSVEAGSPLVIYGDGSQTRDFVHVGDVVKAVKLGIALDRASGETFNVGTGVPTAIGDLAKMFISASGKAGLKISTKDPRPGDIKHSYADISKTRKALGFVPKADLSLGVGEFLTWHSQEGRRP